MTNVREPGAPAGPCSRGELTAGFLRQPDAAATFAARIDLAAYSGFNLLLADHDTLLYLSNRQPAGSAAAQVYYLRAFYGLSNHRLDTPWPKLVRARTAFVSALETLPAAEAFFTLLADRHLAAEHDLPATGVPPEWERLLSAIFVCSPNYGTRALKRSATPLR